MTKSNFDIIFEEYSLMAENILSELFLGISDTSLPETVEESMRYSLFSGGKRIRPVLVLSSFDAFCGCDESVKYLAAAVEMIHTYSLIHDDLPCMDDDELRRGKPTNHIVYGYPMAVLAGDGLLNLAYETILEGMSFTGNLSGYIEASKILARAAGINGMVGGQSADILWEGSEPDEDKLHAIHRNKTGALIKASVLAGAYLATDDEKLLKDICLYGQLIGEMFQIVDDILDITGNTYELGKNVNKDRNQNKMTYPYVYGLENSKIKVEELAMRAKDSLLNIKNGEFLVSLVEYLKNRTK